MKNTSKSKLKIVMGLIILICLLIISFIYVKSKQNNSIIKQEQLNNLQAVQEPQTTVPDGYIGIYTIQQLTQIGIDGDLTANYILMNDFDLNGVEWNIIGKSLTYPFTGSFDGNGYKITGLNIESYNQYVGLFGAINGGTVKNLTLENANIVSKTANTCVGGVVGYIVNGKIENVSITGTSNIENTENASGTIDIGGIVGYAYRNVDSSANSITNVYSTGDINVTAGRNVYAGGIAGRIDMKYPSYYLGVTKAYSTGNINVTTSGVVYAGGLIGRAGHYYRGSTTSYYYDSKITDAYSTGEVNANSTSGDVYAGGLIGWVCGDITNTYAVGKVTVSSSGTKYIGGLIGDAEKGTTVTSSYWSPETTGQTISAGTEKPLLFQQMMQANPYENWDFTNTWEIDEGNTLPYLKGLQKPEQVNKTNYTYTTYEGEGTEENPYIIETEEQLQGMQLGISAHYRLGNDIVIQNIDNFEVIGKSLTYPFTGSFDGNGYKITGLNIESYNQYVGLFGYISGGTVKNLTLENANIVSKTANTYVGGVVGYIVNGTIENVSITGTSNVAYITKAFDTYIGGIVGYIDGTTINNSYSTGKVEVETTNGDVYAGGIVGYAYRSVASSIDSITNVYSTGDINVTADEVVYAGGIAGCIDMKYPSYYLGVTKAYSTGNINVTTSGVVYAGGLIGRAGHYYRGSTTSYYYDSKITDAYSTGEVNANSTSGDVYAGGLIGWVCGDITNTYAVGKVTVSSSGTKYIGGLIGDAEKGTTVTSSYWSPETTGQTISAGTEQSLLFQQMIQANPYENWDFTDIWEIEEGNTLPYLKDLQKPEQVNEINYTYTIYEGEGTEENPYIIETEEQLQGMRNIPYAHYKLGNDIVITENFEPIGGNENTAFTGTLDGAGYTIIGLDIESDNQYVGLFGYISGGTVKNLILENININKTYTNTTNAYYIGGIAGYIKNGVIHNVEIIDENSKIIAETKNNVYIGGIVGYRDAGTIYSTYSVAYINATSTSGTIYAGGLIGYTTQNASINIVYSTGTVDVTSTSGTIYAGGLIGYACSNSYNTYSTSNVETSTKGTIYAGGLIGYANSISIGNAYAVGKVDVTGSGTKSAGGLIGGGKATVTSSYWSPETTGQLISVGAAKPLLLQQMIKANPYENWDFIDIWTIEEGNTLPYLKDLQKPEQVNEINYTYITYEGEGTEENPYIIETEEQLQGIKNGPSGYYKLGNNIEITENFEPIGGNENTAFTGTLDGAGYKIIGLNIDSDNQCVGLFGYISGGTVKNLILENATVKSQYTSSTNYYAYVGGVVGYITNGTIKNVNIIGTSVVKAEKGYVKIGGIAGHIDAGTIDNAYSVASINATSTSGVVYAGGIAGYTNNSSISKVYSTGTINANSTSGSIYAGGLIGEAYNSEINNVYSTGDINVNSTSGNVGAGGLIGWAFRYSGKLLSIENAYAVGKVAVIGNGTKSIGGLIGCATGVPAVTSSYWSPETTGQLISVGAEQPLLLQQMIQASSFENWDFTDIWTIEEGKTLPYLRNMVKPEQVNASNYTYVVYEGNGTEEDPYIIRTQEQLQGMKNIPYAHYKLGNDIVINKNFEPIGLNAKTAFTGNLDGDGKTISNLSIESDNQYTGLFGYISGGTVKNLTIENANIVNTYGANNSGSACVGTVAGYIINGTIENVGITGISSVENKVGINIFIGGLVGLATDNTQIKRVYSNAMVNTNVTGLVRAGGLIGGANKTSSSASFACNIEKAYSTGEINVETKSTNHSYVGGFGGTISDSNISNVFSTGAVNATIKSTIMHLGGLFGGISIGSKIENAYAVGKVAVTGSGTKYVGGLIGTKASDTTVTQSYWSPKTTNQSISDGGTEKSIQELLYQTGYEDNWDFDSIWTIEPNGESLAYLKDLPMPDGIMKDELDFETRVSVKITDTNKKALYGAQFIVKDASGNPATNSEGNLIGELTTNKNGTAYILNLIPGTYSVQETIAPASYIINSNTYNFTLTDEGKTVDASGNEMNLIIENEQLKIEVYNKDKETNEVIVGAKIGLYNLDGSRVLGIDGNNVEAITDSDGKATLNKMVAGTYKYKVIKPAAGYKANSNEYTVTILDDGTVSFGENNNGVIEDVKIGLKGMQIEVVDKDNPDVKIQNARLEISQTDLSNSEIKYYSEDLYTDSNGIVSINEEEIRAFGNMLLELEAFEVPLGYKTIQTKAIGFKNNSTNGITLNNNITSDDVVVTIDNTTDMIYVRLFATRDTVNMKVSVVDANNTNIVLGNAKVSVKDSIDYTTSGTTSIMDNLVLNPTKGTSGTTTYNIKVENSPLGYVDNLVQNITVSFDSKGNIINASSLDDMELAFTEDELSVKLKLARNAVFDKAYIILSEKDNTSNVLKGAEYSISMTSDDGFEALLTDVTDMYGKINVEFYGNENISIGIKQNSAVSGYKIDKEEKTVVLDRVEDILQLNNELCSGNMSIYNVDNELYIELTNERKTPNNILNIQAVYDKDRDIKLQNIPFTITADSYEFSGITDINGNLEVSNILAKANETYTYTVTLGSLPSIAYEERINQFKINITFDELGYISKVNLVEDSEFVSTTCESKENDENINYIANVQVDLGYKNNMSLYIIKEDEKTSNRVEGIGYEVTLKMRDSSTGKTLVSKVQKKTDSNGQFAITVPIGSENDSLTIELKELSTLSKYIINRNKRTVVLDVNSNGVYELRNSSTEDITVDLSNQTATKPYIALTEKAKLKVNSTAKTELNLNLDVSNLLGAKLGGLKYDIYEYKENLEIYTHKYSIITDTSGKATQNINIENAGVYTFKIYQQNEIPGHSKVNCVTVRIRYEVVDGEMKCQSFIIIKGNEYVLRKETKEIESDNCYRYDMNLYLINNFVSTQIPNETEEKPDVEPVENAKTCYIRLEKAGTTNNYMLPNAVYTAVITYSNGSKEVKNIKTNLYGIAILNNIYLDGAISIELKETSAPAGYELDNNTYTINIVGNQTNGLTEVMPSTTSTVAGMECTRNGREIRVKLKDKKKPSTVKINNSKYFLDLNLYKEDDSIPNMLINGAIFKVVVKIGDSELFNKNIAIKNGNYKESRIAIPRELEGKEGTIEITEIVAPDKYELDEETKTIKFNIADGKIKYTTDNNDIKVTSGSYNSNVFHRINVVLKNKLKNFALIINKVDKDNNTISLNGSSFRIETTGDSLKTMDITNKGTNIVFPKGGTNETVRYKITETKAGNGYKKLDKPILIDVTFDESGNVSNAETVVQEGYDSSSVVEINKSDKLIGLKITNKAKKYINGVEIDDDGGETINPDKYTIVFVTKDKNNTNKIIDGLYNVSLIASNGVSKNFSVGTNRIVEYNTYGDIEIGFEQVTVKSGYILDGEQKSLVINRTDDNTLSFVEKNGEFDYYINDTTKVITITNYNETDIAPLNLTLETEAKYQGLEFDVTSVINDNKSLITNINGIASTSLNEPDITSVEYTIKSNNMPKDCMDIPDIKMVIDYDSDNLIKSAKITEGQKNAEIIGEYVGKRYIRVKINIKEAYEDPEDSSKKPVEEAPKEYRYDIIYVKQDEQDGYIRLENVEFEIDITKETGTHKIHNVTTNKFGVAKDRYLTTYGETKYVLKELSTVEGYVLDEQPKTIVIGKTDKNEAKLISASDGLNVIISEKSKQIKVILKNKVDSVGDENNPGYAGIVIEKTDSADSLVKIPNVNFAIQSENGGKVYSATTNDEGYTKVLIPLLKENTERTYIIRENTVPDGYIQYTGDIKLKIKYNSDGIESASIVDAATDTNGSIIATVTKTEANEVGLRITNEQTEYIPSKNELKPYDVKIIKVDENDIEITKQGAKLKVDVSNTVGVEAITKTDVTDENGIVSINGINGFGDIRIDITELEAPENMKLETETKWITLHRSEETGSITHTASSDVFYDINNSERIVTVYLTNKLDDNLFTIVMNKIDSNDEGIEGAEFEVTLPNGDKVERIASIKTGFACITDLEMPEEAGTYTYTIKETKAPKEYKLLKEEINVNITFELIEEKMCITKVTKESDFCKLINTSYINLSDGHISKLKTENTTGEITTKNCFELDIINDKLEPISLEIEKVDKEDNDKKLKGAAYKIEIKDVEEDKVIKTIDSTLDSAENGIVRVDELRGSGILEFTITEIKYPIGYKDENDGVTIVKTIKISRDQIDGTMTAIDGIVQEQIDNENRVIKLKIENELKDAEFELKINKTDEETNEKLSNVKFKVTAENEAGEAIKIAIKNGVILDSTEITTDSDGVANLTGILVPKPEGVYIYTVEEVETIKGYKTNYEPIRIKITTGINDEGLYGILNSEVIKKETLKYPLEIVVAKNNTEFNTNNFKEDLIAQLQKEGVDISNINIETVKKDKTSSNSADAETILNTWEQVGQITYTENNVTYDKLWEFKDQNVICKYNTDDLTGYVFPGEGAQGISLEYDATSENGDDDAFGAIIRYNKNADGTVTTYVFSQARDVRYNPADPWANYYGLYKIESKEFKYQNITLLKSCSKGWLKDEYAHYKIDATGNTIKVSMNGEEIINYTDTSNPIESGSYGFFSFSQANTKFKNITAITTNYDSMSYDTVNNEYEWDKDSLHCVINISDFMEDPFNSENIDKTVSKSINNELTYIGLGTDNNKKQYLNYIEKNDNNGTFIDNKNYDKSIVQVAEYINVLLNAKNKIKYPNVSIYKTVEDIAKEKITVDLSNEKIEPFDVQIIAKDIDNENADLSGISYKVKVTNIETNTVVKEIENTGLTEQNGILNIEDISGVGKFKIEIERITVPNGYKEDVNKNTILYIIRDDKTGIINVAQESSEKNAEIDNKNRIVKITIENELKDGELNITINKVKEDGTALQGATFSIIKVENDKTQTKEDFGVTNALGKVSKKIVLPKTTREFTYILKETGAPKGYKIAEDNTIKISTGIRDDGSYGPVSVTLNDKTQNITNDQLDVKIVNEEIEGFRLEITTVNKDNTEQKLSGAKYKIVVKDLEENKVIKTIESTEVSNVLGKILTEEIKGVGNIEITIEQIAYPNGYKEDSAINKTIKINRDLTDGKITAVDGITEEQIDNDTRIIRVQVGNELKDGELTLGIEKTDENGVHLQGAEFSIVKLENGVEGTAETIGTTNAEGKVEKTIVLPKTSSEFAYVLKETKTPKGYKTGANRIITIKAGVREDGSYGATEVNVNGTAVNVLEDKAIIKVVNEEIEGFKLEITTVNKDNTEQKLSGAKYKIVVKDVEENKVIKTIESTEVSNVLGKILTEEIKGVGNIEITIEQIAYPNGYKEDSAINKTIKINRDLTDGKITAVDGITEEQIDNDTRIIRVQVGNELKDGELTLGIEKTDENGVHLQGAEFSIVKLENGVEGTAETIGTTNAEGKVEKTIVLPKTSSEFAYVLKETKTPKGYKTGANRIITIKAGVREDGSYGATEVNVNGTAVNVLEDKAIIKVVNEEIEGFKLEITTVNKDNTEQKLSGAKYKIVVKDVEENKVIKTIESTEESDTLGKILTEEIKGVGNIEITIEQIAYSNGYKEENNSKVIRILRNLTDGTISAVDSITDEQIDNIERILKIEIENEPKDPILEVVLHKLDKDNNQPLANAKFKIGKENSAEEDIELLPTDEKGQTKSILTLPKAEGTYNYIIKEIESPLGYVKIENEMILKVNVVKMNNGAFTVKSVTFNDILNEVNDEKTNIEVKNEVVTPFVIELITQDDDNEMHEVIPDAKYDISIKNITMNTDTTLKNLTSDVLGKILTKQLYGVGDIEIRIRQVSTPKEYILDQDEKIIKIQRELTNGNITLTSTDGNNIEVTEINNDGITDKKIQITITNEIMKPYVDVQIKKVDKNIIKNELKGAIFEIKLPDGVVTEDGQTTIVVNMLEKTIEDLQIPLPKSRGEYEYIITELQAPAGYNKLNVPISLKITVEKQKGIYVAKKMTAKNEGSRMVTVQNNVITIANKVSDVRKYNIDLEFKNLSYNKDTEFKLELQAETGENILRNLIVSKQSEEIGNVMGTGEVLVNIYDMKEDGQIIGTVKYYRSSATYEISNIEVNKLGNYEIEAEVIESEANVNDIRITIRNMSIDVQSPIYSVSEEDKLIYGISPNTSITEFCNNISTNQNYTIIDAQGNAIDEKPYKAGLMSGNITNNILGTGSKLKVGNTTYTLVVKGDTDGNGKITITDVTKINLHIVNINKLDGIYAIAADTNFNKEISITDLVQVRLALVGLLEL